jgi:hypothetical protein
MSPLLGTGRFARCGTSQQHCLAPRSSSFDQSGIQGTGQRLWQSILQGLAGYVPAGWRRVVAGLVRQPQGRHPRSDVPGSVRTLQSTSGSRLRSGMGCLGHVPSDHVMRWPTPPSKRSAKQAETAGARGGHGLPPGRRRIVGDGRASHMPPKAQFAAFPDLDILRSLSPHPGAAPYLGNGWAPAKMEAPSQPDEAARG